MESQSCLSTAMVFFHKYFLFKKVFSHDYTKYLTCCTCVFLSLKVSNLIVPLEKLIDTFLFLYFRENYQKLNINEKLISEISNKVFQIEFEILNAIGFDLNVDLPYKYIYLMKPYFEESFNAQFYSKYILIVTSFINDSFKLPVCLYYEPLLIFLACVYLVEIYFKIQLKDKAEKKWFQLIDSSVQFLEVEKISAKIKMIYDYSNSLGARGAQASSSSVNSLTSAPNEQKKFVIDFDPVFLDESEKKEKGFEVPAVRMDVEAGKDIDDHVSKCEGKNLVGVKLFEDNCGCDGNKNNDRNFVVGKCISDDVKEDCADNKLVGEYGFFGSKYDNIDKGNENEAEGFNCNTNINKSIKYINVNQDAFYSIIDKNKNYIVNKNNFIINNDKDDQCSDCYMNPDIEEENAQRDNLNKSNKQINDDIHKKESAENPFFNNYNKNNNNLVSNIQINNNKIEIEMIVDYTINNTNTYFSNNNNNSIFNQNNSNIDKSFSNFKACNNNNNNNDSSNFNNKNKTFTNNFEKEFLFKVNNNYSSDFSRIKTEEHLKI